MKRFLGVAVTLAASVFPVNAQEAKPSLPAGAWLKLGLGNSRITNNLNAVSLSPDGQYLAFGSSSGDTMLVEARSGKEVNRFSAVNYSHQIAFSHDSKTMAIASNNLVQGVAILEIPSGKQISLVRDSNPQNQNQVISSLSFCKDGSKLAIGFTNFNNQKNTVVLADTASGKIEQTMEVGGGQQMKSAISPDGKKIVAQVGLPFNNGVRAKIFVSIWGVQEKKELHKIEIDRPNITALQIAPDSKSCVVSAGQSAYYFIDLDTGKEIQRLVGRKGNVASLSYSPDGKYLLSGSQEGSVQRWDTSTWMRLDYAESPLQRVSTFGYCPDGQIVAAGVDGQFVSAFDALTGKLFQSAEGHQSQVRTLTFLSNDALASVSADGKVCFWDIPAAKETKHFFIRETDLQPLVTRRSIRAGHFLISNNGKLAAGGSEFGSQFIRLWDLDKKEILYDFDAFRQNHGGVGGTPSFAFSADSTKMLGGSNMAQSALIWDTATGKEYSPLYFDDKDDPNPQNRNIYPNGISVALSAKGTYAVAARLLHANGMPSIDIALWDVEKSRRIAQYKPGNANNGMLPYLAFSPNSHLLAVPFPDRSIAVWKASNGKELLRLAPPQASISWPHAIAFSPDSRLLAGLFTYSTASAPIPIPGNPNAFRTNSIQTTKVVIWEIASGSIRLEFDYQAPPLQCLAFSPDGHSLATGGQDSAILFWDVSHHRLLPKPFAEPAELAKGWEGLIAKEGKAAYKDNLLRFVAAGERAVAFLQDKIAPIQKMELNREEISQWIADLESDTFALRSKATKSLERLGDAIEPDLQTAFAKATSLEAQRRLQGLLDRMTAQALTDEQMRQVRAIEILERIRTQDAIAFLERLASGAPQAPLTVDARAALDRLAR